MSTTDEKTLCGLVPIKSIYEKNMHTHDALLMANADYESCIDSHIDLSGFQALFVLDGQMGTNPLCIKNPILDKPTIINFSENVFSCHYFELQPFGKLTRSYNNQQRPLKVSEF